jgi:ATP-dependent helicase/nuclease subunit B
VSAPAPSREALLDAIAAGRRADPLAPVTVISPSHVAALQMRRALAERGPFAAVRFETLPRLAELLGAGRLADGGRRPLARPIGDHVAERVGYGAQPPLTPIADLPGFGRALRRLFARLRRGGLVGGEPPPAEAGPHLAEVMRLYGLWRGEIAGFYDEDDLLDAAADAVDEDPAVAAELGTVHLVPPGPPSAAGRRLLEALGRARGGVAWAAEPEPTDAVRLVLAPDLASEAREAVRAVLVALDGGAAVHEVAILHGADPAYARPLREAMAAAGVPAAATPGLPLVETPAGRGVLALLEIALEDLSRTAFIDALSVAPMRRELPSGAGTARLRLGRWDRHSRAAGVTHGITRWREGIRALAADRVQQMDDAAREGFDRGWLQEEVDEATELLAVVDALWTRLVELREERPAADFLRRLGATVAAYLEPDAAGMAEVQAEIERLGTIDAVGGTFTLASFHRALRVNLEAAAIREGRSGEGVLIADHRAAAGLRFGHLVVCGAAEGLLPAGPGADALVPDAAWAALRADGHPLVEDAALRVDRRREAAERAVACGASVVMTCPLYEGAGAHDRYPSPLALEAARRRDPSIATATALREHPATDWLSTPPSPLAAHLRGPAVDAWEAGLRGAVLRVQAGGPAPAGDPLARPLAMLRARRGRTLSEWDGNLSGLDAGDWMRVPGVVSPTRLENYGACGFRFLLSTLLGLRVPDEPSDDETIDPLTRGNLMHRTLEDFFTEARREGRPAVREAWTAADEARAQEILTGHLADARVRGRAGLAVFTRQDERALRADLTTFLLADTEFRRQTGAVPESFEQVMAAEGPRGQRFRGYIDRIDRDPVTGRLEIIDYKTGRKPDDDPSDPFAGGTRLQLPVYLLAAGDAPARASYWYISSRGGFERVGCDSGPDTDARFAATVGAVADGVAAGSFPAVPGEFSEHWVEFANCGHCDFTRICTRGRGEDFARKADDDGVRPWAGVARAAAPEAPGAPGGGGDA